MANRPRMKARGRDWIKESWKDRNPIRRNARQKGFRRVSHISRFWKPDCWNQMVAFFCPIVNGWNRKWLSRTPWFACNDLKQSDNTLSSGWNKRVWFGKQARHGNQPWYHKQWTGVFVGTCPYPCSRGPLVVESLPPMRFCHVSELKRHTGPSTASHQACCRVCLVPFLWFQLAKMFGVLDMTWYVQHLEFYIIKSPTKNCRWRAAVWLAWASALPNRKGRNGGNSQVVWVYRPARSNPRSCAGNSTHPPSHPATTCHW